VGLEDSKREPSGISVMTFKTIGEGVEEGTKCPEAASAAYPLLTNGSITLRRRLIRGALVFSILVWASDIIYRIVNDVSYVNRERCVLYKNLPRMWFVLFEYLFETVIIVFVGIFLAVLLGRFSHRFQRFFPTNPLTAFVYGSLIPVCSCAVIPLLSIMKKKMRFATTMSFVLAAPLLSPYILVLSFSVLGFTYGMLRIAASFILVMSTVLVLAIFHRGGAEPVLPDLNSGCSSTCDPQAGDVYLETYGLFRRMLPYLIVGGALGVLLEYMGPRTFLLNELSGKGVAGVLAWILIGVPLYFCNGAEVLFLRPLVNHGFPLGTAMGFSLTSTAICITSIAMLLKTIGNRLTIALVTCVATISFVIALIVNSMI
jgi:uncharacterized membrane protein YraQ (UPF0718 family)